jgi:hypothetical protein
MTDASKKSAHSLHFVAGIDRRRGMVSFCCENEPLATVRSYGRPKRCPFCHQVNPLSPNLSVTDVHEEKI